MADNEKKTTMREFATNDHANYYSGITSITVNGKNAYELKRRFLDDLHDNAFSGTYREDAVEHIEYFLKIFNPINLPNVNRDRLRVVVFPISLKSNDSNDEAIDDGFSDLKEANYDDEQEIDEIFRIKTNLFNFETPLCTKFNEFNYLLKDLAGKEIDNVGKVSIIWNPIHAGNPLCCDWLRNVERIQGMKEIIEDQGLRLKDEGASQGLKPSSSHYK
uniref:Reverse transcriptase domain-containing protein n=1 Tax=Tanacetum cinerariifolium TaxID=118510 RepID=A0A6L2KSC5_TANCI|nr:hypothetical protein [Tanacetum cinerariifolium]